MLEGRMVCPHVKQQQSTVSSLIRHAACKSTQTKSEAISKIWLGWAHLLRSTRKLPMPEVRFFLLFVKRNKELCFIPGFPSWPGNLGQAKCSFCRQPSWNDTYLALHFHQHPNAKQPPDSEDNTTPEGSLETWVLLGSQAEHSPHSYKKPYPKQGFPKEQKIREKS